MSRRRVVGGGGGGGGGSDDGGAELELERLGSESKARDDEEPLISEPDGGPRRRRAGGLLGALPCGPAEEPQPRTVLFEGAGGGREAGPGPFPPNVVLNTKYTLLTFLPLFLYGQFRYFFNLYFLVVALTQFVPVLQIGFLFTYVAPLVFVLLISMAKEGYEDVKRWRRDREANSERFERLADGGAGATESVPSSDLRVGDLVVLSTNQRVPADMVLMHTTERSGSVFVRTDQLDGETDWKLRRPVPSLVQRLDTPADLLQLAATLESEAPRKEIYDFCGAFTLDGHTVGLSLENTLWADTVVASGTVVGCVVFTGRETRSVMNTNAPATKVGLVDLEINDLSKILFFVMVAVAFLLTALKGFDGIWGIYFFRFVLLLSSIIPISLRVNLDLGKALYSYMIARDAAIPGTVVRTSTIPEELGRVTYLFSDKTGTLTRNEMTFDTLQLEPPLQFSKGSLPLVAGHLRDAFDGRGGAAGRRVRDAVTAIALCHNVTPVDGQYQASSPDEVALVRFTESVGLTLHARDRTSMELRTPSGAVERYEVLHLFPFTSATKRMGIVVRRADTGRVTFVMKGAESVMKPRVEAAEWLDEETDNLARAGLRTLVVGQRHLDEAEYADFRRRYEAASAAVQNRDAEVAAAVARLERGLELLALTGVEDRLQEGVEETLETLRNAGIRVWMLTGDKAETAMCIGRSARLVDRNQDFFVLEARSKGEAARSLDAFGARPNACLVVDGPALALCLEHFEREFLELACQAPAVIACRCSPTQKSEIVTLMMDFTRKRCAAVGDGGNDVSMIQCAHLGLGIVGKEGKQASLAADFSVTQFSFLQPLLLWHGRNSYKRSARLAQFVIHRGLSIAFVQCFFSVLFYYAALPVFNGWLLVGYSSFYTMLPIFSLVLDEDADRATINLFPELYKELQKGRPLSYKTFAMWLWVGAYQGGVIVLMTIVMFENSFINFVGISFTALILTELLTVALLIQRWNRWMVIAQVLSVIVYVISVFTLRGYFDVAFLAQWSVFGKLLLITLVACLPPAFLKLVYRRFFPPAHAKVAAHHHPFAAASPMAGGYTREH